MKNHRTIFPLNKGKKSTTKPYFWGIFPAKSVVFLVACTLFQFSTLDIKALCYAPQHTKTLNNWIICAPGLRKELHCNESLIILHLNSYRYTYKNKTSFLLLYSIDINNKQFVEMKYILPKSGANLVQFSRQSEWPLLKCSHMQDSIDGLESLFFFM